MVSDTNFEMGSDPKFAVFAPEGREKGRMTFVIRPFFQPSREISAGD
jgi:hypothetical protein